MSAPQRMDHRSFSTSSSIEEVTAELPMLALIFTRKLRPMIIGSLSGWLTFDGMIARPRATSSRTNSGVITEGIAAPHDIPGCCATPPPQAFPPAPAISSRASSRRWFSRIAMNSISGVTMPLRAWCIWVTFAPGRAHSGLRGSANRMAASWGSEARRRPNSEDTAGSSSTFPRPRIHSRRSGGRPLCRSITAAGSV